MALLLLAARAAIALRDAAIIDFQCFYEAGRLVRVGLDPYDRADWSGVAHVEGGVGPHCALTFVYPMPTAMAMVPLSLVPEPVALAVWEVALVASVVAGIAILARLWGVDGRWLTVAALLSEPVYSAVANGQFGPLIFLVIAVLTYALERGRTRLALVAWSLLLVKPHITLVVLAGAPLFTRLRLALATAVVALVGIASVVLAPRWPVEYLNELFGQQLALDRGLSTLWTVAADLGLPSIVGGAVAVALGIVFVLMMPRPLRSPRAVIAVLVAIAFVVTPYLRPHDLIGLATCWICTLALAPERWVRGTVIAIALVLPWLITTLTLVGLALSSYVAVPLATIAITLYALRVGRPAELSVAAARPPS